MAQGQQTGQSAARRGREEEQDRENRQQQRQQGGGQHDGGQQQPSMVNMTAMAARGLGQIYDMQLAASRMLLQTQARAASVFGIPDYSGLFRIGDDRARRVFSTTTDELVEVTQRTSDTVSEIQRHVGRLLEVNAVNMSESWRQGLQEFATQAEDSLEQLQELARQQADEAVRAAQEFSEMTRQTMRQGGEEMRETMRQGAERGREATAEAGEAARQEAERAGQAEQEGERAGRRTRAA